MADQQPRPNIGTDVWNAIPPDVKSTIITQLLTGLLAMLGGLFHKKPSGQAPPVVPVVPKPVEEEPLVEAPTPPTAPTPVFSASVLNVMDVNGEGYNPENAVGWGSYIRLDSNPKDQFGAPLPFELIDPTSPTCVVQSIEWRSTWDGEADTEGHHHVNVGGNLYNNSNGYACSLKIFKEKEDAQRHQLDVWVAYHLKNGGVVESNEVRLAVD